MTTPAIIFVSHIKQNKDIDFHVDMLWHQPPAPNPASQQTVIPVYPLAPAADTKIYFFPSSKEINSYWDRTKMLCLHFVWPFDEVSAEAPSAPPPPFAQEGVTNPGNPGLRKSNQAWLINTCFKQRENQCMKCLAIGDQLSCHSFFLFLCHEGNNDFLWVSFEFVVTQFGTNVHRPPSREAARHFLLNKSTRRRHERWRRISPINNPGSIRFKPPSPVFLYLIIYFCILLTWWERVRRGVDPIYNLDSVYFSPLKAALFVVARLIPSRKLSQI